MRQKTALVLTMVVVLAASTSMAGEIIHDAEQQILEEQFGEQWAAQDVEIQKKLDELYAKYGKRPNIVHIMWDDNSFGEVGIPVMNKIRGYDTPHLNKMGQDGIVFTRMYTEPSCTPTRAAALTGRLAVRSGMYTVAFPPEGSGLPGEEVTIAENTLVVAMADNGPITEAPMAMYQVIFNGGKGDYREGGIRVAAFSQWKGVTEPGTIVGDIFTVHDLFTTFARIGGGMDYIPTDRIIDGIDQTAVFLYGDGQRRRDYYHVYTGPYYAATIKQQFKRKWLGGRPGLVKNDFFDLYQDPREMRGMMAQFLWAWGPFDMVKHRHDAMKEKYPDTPTRKGVPFEGIENLRPESLVYQETVRKTQNMGK